MWRNPLIRPFGAMALLVALAAGAGVYGGSGARPVTDISAPIPANPDRVAAGTGAAPGVSRPADPACPGGELTWSVLTFVAIPVETTPGAGPGEWLVQEQGTVDNRSGATIVVGDGVARVGPSGPGLTSVVDLPLTPLGSLSLAPGQTEPFSGAEMLQSVGTPQNLGLGLPQAGWQDGRQRADCPPPGGARTPPASGADAIGLA